MLQQHEVRESLFQTAEIKRWAAGEVGDKGRRGSDFEFEFRRNPRLRPRSDSIIAIPPVGPWGMPFSTSCLPIGLVNAPLERSAVSRRIAFVDLPLHVRPAIMAPLSPRIQRTLVCLLVGIREIPKGRALTGVAASCWSKIIRWRHSLDSSTVLDVPGTKPQGDVEANDPRETRSAETSQSRVWQETWRSQGGECIGGNEVSTMKPRPNLTK
jgi:hypothetical protein